MRSLTDEDKKFVFRYVLGLFVVAIILDPVLHVIGGSYVIIVGLLVGGGLFANRRKSRK